MRWFPHATSATIAERLAALEELRESKPDHWDQHRIGHRVVYATAHEAKVKIPSGWQQKVSEWKRRYSA